MSATSPSFTLTNSYVHNANVGHEVKSRAGVTTITNNVHRGQPDRTASYDIDIPNAGAAIVSNNVIEKGPEASNVFAIHYGGETQYSWADNSLSVNGNTFLDDYGPDAYAVANDSSYNGLDVSANLDRQQLLRLQPAEPGLWGSRARSPTPRR